MLLHQLYEGDNLDVISDCSLHLGLWTHFWINTPLDQCSVVWRAVKRLPVVGELAPSQIKMRLPCLGSMELLSDKEDLIGA